MIINLYIREFDGLLIGESLELCINSNIPELASTPIEFYGDSQKEILEQVKAYARHKFGSGSIRLH